MDDSNWRNRLPLPRLAPVTAPSAIGPNQPCWCGSGQKYKKCHRDPDAQAAGVRRVQPGRISPPRAVPPEIPRPDYAVTGHPGPGSPIDPDPARRLARMRRACRAAAEVLAECGQALRPGLTTDAIDAVCHAAYLARGGYPSTLNYRGFPKSLCTSVNEVVLHGIPDDRAMLAGDIVNFDVTIFLDGMHGDCSATFPVGEIDQASQRLVTVTEEAMLLGIEAVKPGRTTRAIGRAIEAHATRHGYGVVRSFCGHGVGERFHDDPVITHFDDPRATAVIEEGMIFTVEPMLTEGTPQVSGWRDGWTVVTADGKRSAQFEHTIVVTRDGAEILTEL